MAQAVGHGVLSIPGGRIRESGSELAVRFDAEYRSVDEIGSLQVAGADGARRYLRDLGTVRLATEEPRQRAFLNGEPGVTVKVVKKSDGNTVDTVRELRRRVAELRRELPPGTELLWLQDDAEIVQANVDNTVADIGYSILLCAVILFAFLVNLRSTFVVAVTMLAVKKAAGKGNTAGTARPAHAARQAPRVPLSAEHEEAVRCAHVRGKQKYIEQLDSYLKNGIIDKAEYKVLRERYEKLELPDDYH